MEREESFGMQCADGLRNIRRREEQDTPQPESASSPSLPVITNTLAWVSQSGCSVSRSPTVFSWYSSLFQLTLSFQQVLWVTDVIATATGCEEGELGRAAIKIMGLSLV